MLTRIRVDRRLFLVGGGLLVGLLVLLGVLAVVVRLSGGTHSSNAHTRPTEAATSAAPATPGLSTPATTPATDAASWDAIPAISPAISAAYPAIIASDLRDPDAFSRAFVVELFTRNYGTSTRAQLVSWAQYQDAPLQSAQYPKTDWSKVLVNSLTDLTWDAADDTPIPADGPWLALRSERTHQSVSDVKVSLDPKWEQQVADGYQPPDPLATVRDVSLTITQRATAAGPRESTFSVSLAVQLGSSARGDGYGVAATNNYVIKEAS